MSKPSEEATREQLMLTLDALPVLVSFVDAEERYGFVNKAYEDWFGIPRESLLGKTVLEVIGQSAYAVLSPYVRRGLAGERFSTEQRNVPYRLGRARDIRVSFIPRHDAEGRTEGYVALLEDITEQQRAQEVLRQQAELEQQLLGIVSHDLRNPVTAILMSAATLLRRQDLEDRIRNPLRRILTSAERATRMIRDLLDFTQARLGRGLPIEAAPLDLHQLADQVVEEMIDAHPERAVQVEHRGEPDVTWDGDRISQVLTNLLGNALQYGDPASAIRVKTTGDAHEVTLEVQNAGEPVPPAILPRIFEPMQRAATHSAQARNVGLGLYIVKQIVEAHGGVIDVTSTRDAGTSFVVKLPRRCAGRRR